MKGSSSRTGWTGRMDAPRTIERKRKGRDTDRIMWVMPQDLRGSRLQKTNVDSMPTPPREQSMSHLPTPDSVRRPTKPTVKADKMESVIPTQQMLPTPQTLPRQPRKAVVPLSTSSATDDEIATPPSPSGHTTFFLSSSSASGSRGEKISRRRPGLTFAQQMGLLTTTSGGQPCGQASRPGVGVGMGGSRTGGHKKDQVVWGHLAEPVALGGMDEENPFITKSTLLNNTPKAPGLYTLHRPRAQLEDEDTSGVEELKYRHPSGHLADPTTGLLTPPPTKVERGIRTIPKDPAEEARKRENKARMRQMMDVESNPFLVKPGESSRSKHERRVSPVVDETQPTVTYVFRGAKKVFANPFYPSDAPFPHALLDPEDEDYEPHPNPKPRLLWPSPPPNSKRIDLDAFNSPPGVSPPSSPISTPKRRLFTKNSMQVDSDHDEDEEEDEGEEVTATPTARRLFMPSTVPAKRQAEQPTQETKRDEKKFKGMRV